MAILKRILIWGRNILIFLFVSSILAVVASQSTPIQLRQTFALYVETAKADHIVDGQALEDTNGLRRWRDRKQKP